MAIFTGANKLLGGTEAVARKETVYYGLVQQNVLVTGANGQLGQELLELAERINTPLRFIRTDTNMLDITDARQVRHFVEQYSARYIINCAAYTGVDKAENDAPAAYAVNCEGAKNLAAAAVDAGAKLLHLSTDYVFDGQARYPYRETSPTNPLSVYGQSKLRGEEAVQATAPDSIILRTSWLYSQFGNNFVKTMLRLMQEKEELSVVSDQLGTPTYAADLAEMILVILESAEWKPGLYHFSNRGETTWYGFAEKIKELFGLRGCRVNPVSTSEYKTTATRPMYSVLDKTKIETAFGVVIPRWEESLERCVGKLRR